MLESNVMKHDILVITARMKVMVSSVMVTYAKPSSGAGGLGFATKRGLPGGSASSGKSISMAEETFLLVAWPASGIITLGR
jgi:hypothetical protein